MALISVIIPTFNRPELTVQAIQSVIRQTFKDFDLWVIDDGSTVGTDAIAQAVEQCHANFVSTPHAGVSAARNVGVRLSTGRYLAFLDSDDQWLQKKLEKQMEFFAARPDLRLCQSLEQWIRNGRVVNPKRVHAMPEGDAFYASLDRCIISPSSVILEQKLFHEIGGFDEDLPACEDYDLWLRITATEQVGLVRECLVRKYGGHADQLSKYFQAMDRFRVYALVKLLLRTALSDEQTQAVKLALLRKLRVLLHGAEKRGSSAIGGPLYWLLCRELLFGLETGGAVEPLLAEMIEFNRLARTVTEDAQLDQADIPSPY